jgi:hypothetical protein
MVRRIGAVVLALALNPTLVRAQDAVFTVTVPSADVHKGPSTVTPVIGHVSRGTVLAVARNLGSWARVPWPDAPEGIGYVHVTMGRFGAARSDASPANVPSRASSASSAPAAAIATSAAATTTMPPAAHRPGSERMAIRGELSDTPITHIFGVGALVASRSSFGATTRAWRDDHLGLQLAIMRDAMAGDGAAGRVTSMRVEPGVVYALFDRVTDYVWFRPYVGSAVSFHHQTLKFSAPGAADPVVDNGMGFRVFGGSELTFAGAPRFGLSAELGYRRLPAPFPGFEADRVTVAIAGHWYVR